MATLDTIKKTRQYHRQKVTKLCNKVDKELPNITYYERLDYLDRLQNCKLTLNDLNEQVLHKSIEEELSDKNMDVLIDDDEEYDNKISSAIVQLNSLNLTQTNNDNSNNNNNSTTGNDRNKLKLPQVPLPKFANKKGESLHKFIRSFEAIVDKHSLTSYEKFIYLRNQLSDGPRILIESLDVDQQSYETAKELLNKAFDNTLTSKFEIIQKLSEMRMAKNSEPYAFIGEMRTVLAGISSMKINMDDICQYFVWNGLNDIFQTQLVNITNKSRPSLQEIQDNMFEASARYIKQLEKNNESFNQKDKSKTVDTRVNNNTLDSNSMAVNIKRDKAKISCNLCYSDKTPCDHYMNACPVYKSPKAKFDKLRSIKACTRCSFRNHEAMNCKFQFKSNCRHCNGQHMSYLCLKTNTERQDNVSSHQSVVENDPNNVSNTEETLNSLSLVETEISQVSSTDCNMLPTFTAYVVCNNLTQPVRVFKDGGCQRTFICSALADSLGLPVVRDRVPLTIHGFNTSKTILTKLVRLDVKIGDKCFNVDAIAVDGIRTKFNITNLNRVITEFKNKGYKIADNDFNYNITRIVDNIDLIFGTDSDHLLPMTYKTFGTPGNLSSYIETSIGVIFSGNIDKMIANLNSLPVKLHGKEHSSILSNVCSFNSNNISSIIDTNIETNLQLCLLNYSLSNCEDVGITYDNYNDNDNSLIEKFNQTLDICDDLDKNSTECETDNKLIDFVLNNTKIDKDNDGRLIMPLTWNSKNSHLLSQNYNLALSILKSNYNKLKNDPIKLKMYDDVFKEQQRLGIVEKVEDIEQLMIEHPECSFLAHMGVYRMTHESTKCRVVFLSNLCEKSKGSVSHNQAILPGPSLNHKITTAVMMHRFDKFMLTFDIEKAFLNIKLYDTDQYRLLFLWYNNLEKNDYKIVAYRNLRLSFGLRCSPFILMLALYNILIIEKTGNHQIDDLKKSIYNNIYMDNGSFSCNNREDLFDSYKLIQEIFEPYKLALQQFYTCSPELQEIIDAETGLETPTEVKFFGMIWDRINDSLSPKQLELDSNANTKRSILTSLNGIYDVYNLYAPILLRAKLFMQKLQSMKDLDWDKPISKELSREWLNIVRQANATPVIKMQRYVGKRDDSFSLIAFTDASKDAYGVVLYIKDTITNEVSYLCSKTKLINVASCKKTIPSLEFQAIVLGVKVIVDTYQSLCGDTVVIPIKIDSLLLFSDSMVCLHWLLSYSVYFDKLQNMSVFIKNRLRSVDEMCRNNPITFRHIAGEVNPADYVTRPCSYKLLSRSNYYTGPKFLVEDLNSLSADFVVRIPNQTCKLVDEVPLELAKGEVQVHIVSQSCDILSNSVTRQEEKHLIPPNKYHSFSFLKNVHTNVLRFVNNLKKRLKNSNFRPDIPFREDCELHSLAINQIISTEQKIIFSDVHSYLRSPSKALQNIPTLVSQLNLYRDQNDVLRVQSKFPKKDCINPILLAKNNWLTTAIIQEAHSKMSHSGLYPVLKELRKDFWIVHYYSTVKKVLKDCITCRKIHEPPIKINQNEYREFRANPHKKPFSSVFMDYIGPFTVKVQSVRKKVWLLAITCLWSRAVNLKICSSANCKDFLRAIQLHIYEYGVFQFCISDLGSQIQAGANIITAFFNDFETNKFFESNGVKSTSFQHYAKGNSSLGSLIEICVKQIKLLIYKSIKTVILDYSEFEFLIAKTIHLINKRPIAFKEGLRTLSLDQLPSVITPEILIRGYDTISINVIPQLQPILDDYDPSMDENVTVRTEYERLSKVRERLVEVYHSEFLTNLIYQAIDKKDRYKPVLHKAIKPGDIVLLVDKFLKRYYYPMGKVIDVDENSLGEVTAAHVLKGDTREKVYRHVTSLILLLPSEFSAVEPTVQVEPTPTQQVRSPSVRLAARNCKDRNKSLQAAGSI